MAKPDWEAIETAYRAGVTCERINPANGNETPGFVMQGDQIIMNEAFLKYLSAPTITSGGNPPAFSLTPDGKLTAKNADISGHINAVSGSFTGEINATSGKFSGVIEAREFVGDICGSKVMQGVSIRATNDERSTSTRYTDSATYQILTAGRNSTARQRDK